MQCWHQAGLKNFPANHPAEVCRDLQHTMMSHTAAVRKGALLKGHWQHTRHTGEVFSDLLANPPSHSWQPWHLRQGWKLTVLIKRMNKSLIKLNRLWAYEFCWLETHLWVGSQELFLKHSSSKNLCPFPEFFNRGYRSFVSHSHEKSHLLNSLGLKMPESRMNTHILLLKAPAHFRIILIRVEFSCFDKEKNISNQCSQTESNCIVARAF